MLSFADIQRRLMRIVAEGQVSRATRAAGNSALGTGIGLVRSENQDAVLHLNILGPQGHFDARIAILCDGMGGMRHGREASAIASSVFAASLVCEQKLDKGACWKAINRANKHLAGRFNGNSGTTLSAIVHTAEWTLAVHAGDSRIYVLNEKLIPEQVSQDDTLHAALRQPRTDDMDLSSRLIQFVGMGDGLEPHIFGVDTSTEVVLLTSDGSHDVAPSTFRRIVGASPNPLELVRRLITLADYQGGHDNASAIVVSLADEFSKDRLDAHDAYIEVVTPASTVQLIIPMIEAGGSSVQVSRGEGASKGVKSATASKKQRKPARKAQRAQENESREDELNLRHEVLINFRAGDE